MVYSQTVHGIYFMLEITPVRKNKVNLADYNCRQDIENRMILADSSPFDLEVFEEILFSPLKISLKKLVRNMGCKEEVLLPILKKLSKIGLLSIEEDTILIDKEMRKYFEFQITRFSPDFKPDMEFLQGILRKVPIHLLPTWFSIPRTSNNIFESIVEKYFLTPQVFQRYLQELHFADPVVNSIMTDLFSAPDLTLYSSDVIEKYNLTRPGFEEILLLLEFHFIGYLSYRKEEDHWLEVITPFYEWHQYLRFLKETEAPILEEKAVRQIGDSDFFFIQTMSEILTHLCKAPLPLNGSKPANPNTKEAIRSRALQKLLLIKLASSKDGMVYPSDHAQDWLSKSLEDRALYLYRHAANEILTMSLPAEVATERNIREAEKSIRRVLHKKWIRFDEFLKGVLIALSETSVISLKRIGKHYKYVLPVYSEDEQKLIQAVIFEWLFETGMVAIGVSEGKNCFRVTPFGRFCFED